MMVRSDDMRIGKMRFQCTLTGIDLMMLRMAMLIGCRKLACMFKGSLEAMKQLRFEMYIGLKW